MTRAGLRARVVPSSCHDAERSYLKFLCAVFCLGLVWASGSSPALAGGADIARQWVARARTLHLENHPTWRRLLADQARGEPSLPYHSSVISPGFFLSAEGRTDSAAELEATLRALAQDADPTRPDAHAQCRFRGRWVWLRNQLDLGDSGIAIPACPELDNWADSAHPESISLVYATGYLRNPASYYGHTLLKINSAKTGKTRLEDQAVNFGAILPGGDGLITYVAKGFFGGYEAGFTNARYYNHTHDYGENELRDLWEYRLNLSAEETELLVGHAWEMLGQKYVYYFANRNCAYRMAELLEIVEGIDAVPDTRYWSVPQALVQKLASVRRNGRSLLGPPSYLPSRQSRLYQRYAALDGQQRQLLDRAIRDGDVLESSEFSSIPLSGQQALLDVLLDYYRYLASRAPADGDAYSQQYRQVLRMRYRLPPGSAAMELGLPVAPDQGRKPSLLSAGYTHNDRLGDGALLRLRPVFYDALDSGGGHVPFASLSMLEFELAHFSGKVNLRNLSLLKIESFNLQATGLPGDQGRAWYLDVGARPLDLACTACTTPRVRGGLGYSQTLLDSRMLLSATFGLGLSSSFQGSGMLFSESRLQLGADLRGALRAHVELKYLDYPSSSAFDHSVAGFQIRYAPVRDWDLRLSIEKDEAREARVYLGYYW